MSCPLFIDFTRECIEEVEVLPSNTFSFCTTKYFSNCPFYIVLKEKRPVCKHIKSCPFYKEISIGDFEEFSKITNDYCLLKDSSACARYKEKESGNTPSLKLHPNGSVLTE